MHDVCYWTPSDFDGDDSKVVENDELVDVLAERKPVGNLCQHVPHGAFLRVGEQWYVHNVIHCDANEKCGSDFELPCIKGAGSYGVVTLCGDDRPVLLRKRVDYNKWMKKMKTTPQKIRAMLDMEFQMAKLASEGDYVKNNIMLHIAIRHHSINDNIFTDIYMPSFCFKCLQLDEHFRDRMGVRGLTRVLYQCSNAISHINSLEIYHRDIKPQNFLIYNSNHVFMIDFGFATSKSTDRLYIGTPYCMALEIDNVTQYECDKLDVFSLGMSFVQDFIFKKRIYVNTKKYDRFKMFDTILLALERRISDTRGIRYDICVGLKNMILPAQHRIQAADNKEYWKRICETHKIALYS